MAEFHATVSIARSREDVYTYLVDPGSQTVWNSGLVEFEADWTRDPRVGDRARGPSRSRVGELIGKRRRSRRSAQNGWSTAASRLRSLSSCHGR